MPSTLPDQSTSWWVHAGQEGDQAFYTAARTEQARMRNSILPLPVQRLFYAQLQAEADNMLQGYVEQGVEQVEEEA